MVKEELTSHEVEGEVVQCPAHEEEAAEAVVLEDLAWKVCEYCLLKLIEGATYYCPCHGSHAWRAG